MIRFLLLWPVATLILIDSFAFPEDKRGQFSISRGMVREWALSLVGLKEFL